MVALFYGLSIPHGSFKAETVLNCIKYRRINTGSIGDVTVSGSESAIKIGKVVLLEVKVM